jgi:hypothetical protein
MGENLEPNQSNNEPVTPLGIIAVYSGAIFVYLNLLAGPVVTVCVLALLLKYIFGT